MAFEVFDDVAFYWFLLAILVIFVVPMSFSFMSVVMTGNERNWTRGMSSCKEKCASIDARTRKEKRRKILGWRGAGFFIGWASLIYLGLSFAAMQGEEMFSFNPYKILDIDESASPHEIKKAYRYLSKMCSRPPLHACTHCGNAPCHLVICRDLPTCSDLLWRALCDRYHPDKNPGNPEAQDMFIKVAKANEVLTDEATRENYEKYGNPDGYHGTSVTIGLPSWLTNKENELAILVAYFVVIIIIIPIIVGLWWRNSSKFLEDGVMQNTAYRFYRQVFR
ncbi:MAG: hypothetical protein SGPRY_014041 [Prymnesium sp.]